MVSRKGYIGQCQWEQDPAVTLGASRGDGDGVVAIHVHSLTPPSVARSSSCGDAASSSSNIAIVRPVRRLAEQKSRSHRE